MTSRTDSFPTEYTAAQKYPWQRVAFAFALTLIAIVAFAAAFAVGYARINEGRVLPGVDVGGVDLAGLDRTAAESKLRSALPSLSNGDLTVQVAGQTESIPYSEFGRNYNMDFILDQAFSLGQGSNFVEQLREQMAILMNGISVEPSMTWDNQELASRVAALAVSAEVPPVDAAISRQDGHYVVTPSQNGLSVDAEQAVITAMAAVNNLSPRSAQITVEGTPILPSVTTEEAQAAADHAEAVTTSGLAISGEDLHDTIDPDILRGWVYLNEASLGDWQLTIAADPIAQYLSAYAAATDIPPTNATYGFQNGQMTVVPSAPGRSLDVQASTANVLASLQARADGQPSDSASLALVPVDPEFDTAQAQALVSRVKVLGTWTTNYIPSPLNGNGVNIEIPTSTVDGFVVLPGERFDFLSAIGDITSPPYVEGGVLIHGQIKEDGAIGGGMCSCSTTLFNAALRAGLEIDARSNHSIYISRYPVGLDATVWMSGGSRRTMAFTNDTDYPVLIKGINQRGKVTFELYGIYDGRTVEIQDPQVANTVKGGAWLKFTDDLAPGKRHKIQDAYDSFDARVTRIVRDAQGNVIHTDTFVSHYKKLDAIVLVGRFPGDPPAGTLIRPDDYNPNPTPPPPPPPPPGTLTANFAKTAVDVDTYAFTDASAGDIASWAWDFGDGSTSVKRNPTHDFVPGTYTVTLTVTDSTGATDSKSKTVTVTDISPPPVLPKARFSWSVQDGSPLTVNFIAKNGGADEWVWDFGDGHAGHGQTATNTYDQGGNYSVTLTVSNSDGTASVTHTVKVVAPEPPPV